MRLVPLKLVRDLEDEKGYAGASAQTGLRAAASNRGRGLRRCFAKNSSPHRMRLRLAHTWRRRMKRARGSACAEEPHPRYTISRPQPCGAGLTCVHLTLIERQRANLPQASLSTCLDACMPARGRIEWESPGMWAKKGGSAGALSYTTGLTLNFDFYGSP